MLDPDAPPSQPEIQPDAATSSDAFGGSRLRVLLAVHNFFPDSYLGTERYTLELAKGLQELGHDVTVLTVGPRDKGSPDGLYSVYTYQGVSVVALGGSYLRQQSFEDTYVREDLETIFYEVLSNLQPDLLHACHLINLTPSLLQAAHRCGLPIVLTLTDFWGFCWAGQLTTLRRQQACKGPDANARNCVADYFDAKAKPTTSRLLNLALQPLRGRALHGTLINQFRLLPRGMRNRLAPEIDPLRRRNAFFRDAYAKADTLIAPSQFLLDTYVEHGFPREKFRRIPYGITLPSQEESEALAQRFSGERPESLGLRFGYMGQIAPHKGVTQLVRAFQHAEVPGATLSIHGNLEQQPAYTERLEALTEGDERIQLVGPYQSHDVYKVLAGVDVLVVPSLWEENAPFVLLSALATRTPVVIPRARGMVEFVRDRENGLIYEMHDTPGLRARLAELGRDRELLLSLARDAQPCALSRRDCATSTLEIYRSALAKEHTVAYPVPDEQIEPILRPLTSHSRGPLGSTIGDSCDEDAEDEKELVPDCFADAVLGMLIRAGTQGLDVRLPRPGVERPAGPKKPRGKRLASRPFIPVRRGLRINYHTKSYVSLWSHKGRKVELHRHPDFESAAQVEIVARGNRGDLSRLRYAYETFDGELFSAEFRFSWPKNSWCRMVIPLSTRRSKRWLRLLEWTPVVSEGRFPLKLDVLSIGFRGER